ncbi:MAG: hypothetical protein M3Q07_00445 [Pseudobdellovibrionaceae bacterium]|nr:hypothetical protein [Pseudobdellovibrionaceae bacterium]
MRHYYAFGGLLFITNTLSAQVNCPNLSGAYTFATLSTSCSTFSYESDGPLPVPGESVNPGLLGEGKQLLISQSGCGEFVLSYEHFGTNRQVKLLSSNPPGVSKDMTTQWIDGSLAVKVESGGLGSGNYTSASFQLRSTDANDLEIVHSRTDVSPFFGISRENYVCTLQRQ